jgi:hypothetical protein
VRVLESRRVERIIDISERDFGILEYGSKVYGISRGEYLSKLIDQFLEKSRRLNEIEKPTIAPNPKPNSTVSRDTKKPHKNRPRKKWYGTLSFEEHGIPDCLR